jgi:hypothetical protein
LIVKNPVHPADVHCDLSKKIHWVIVGSGYIITAADP